MKQNKEKDERITLMVRGKHAKKLRAIQANKMLKDNIHVSFSDVCNDIFEKALK